MGRMLNPLPRVCPVSWRAYSLRLMPPHATWDVSPNDSWLFCRLHHLLIAFSYWLFLRPSHATTASPAMAVAIRSRRSIIPEPVCRRLPAMDLMIPLGVSGEPGTLESPVGVDVGLVVGAGVSWCPGSVPGSSELGSVGSSVCRRRFLIRHAMMPVPESTESMAPAVGDLAVRILWRSPNVASI